MPQNKYADLQSLTQFWARSKEYIDEQVASVKYNLPVAGLELGGVVSGKDITVAQESPNAGEVTVNQATKLRDKRTIAIAGDAEGSGSFDGSADVTINVTVADDSHNHIIDNIDGLQAALDLKAPLANPAFTGGATIDGSAVATESYVDTSIADHVAEVAGGLQYKGTVGTGGKVETLPTSDVKIGDFYKVAVAGTYGGHRCEVGDMLLASAVEPAIVWDAIQANIDGAVTGPTSSVGDNLTAFSETSGKIVKDSGISMADVSAALSKLGGIAEGAEVNQNAFGVVNAGGTSLNASDKIDTLTLSGSGPITVTGSGKTATFGITAASGSAAGSMSSDHFTKLEGIEAGAQVNKIESASISEGTGYNAEVVADKKLEITVPYSFKTISDGEGTASAGSDGILTVVGEDGLTVSADGSTLTLGLPATATSNSISTISGNAGSFVADQAGDSVSIVGSNGITTSVADSTLTVTGVNASTDAAGMMSAEDKDKLDGIQANANNYSLPVAGSALGGVLSGGDITVGSTGSVTVNQAAKLTTARTITLEGDVTGGTSFDGSGNVTITAEVADDSHNHVINNIDGLQDALDAKAPLASPALTGTPTAPTAGAGTNTTQIATTAFVKASIDAAVGDSDHIAIKGTVNSSTPLPKADYKLGDAYIVGEAGTYAGETCEAGDWIIAVKDYEADGAADSDWSKIQKNITSAVTFTGTPTAGQIVKFNAATGIVENASFSETQVSDAIAKAGTAVQSAEIPTPTGDDAPTTSVEGGVLTINIPAYALASTVTALDGKVNANTAKLADVTTTVGALIDSKIADGLTEGAVIDDRIDAVIVKATGEGGEIRAWADKRYPSETLSNTDIDEIFGIAAEG